MYELETNLLAPKIKRLYQQMLVKLETCSEEEQEYIMATYNSWPGVPLMSVKTSFGFTKYSSEAMLEYAAAVAEYNVLSNIIYFERKIA